jgi:hypothetical protein
MPCSHEYKIVNNIFTHVQFMLRNKHTVLIICCFVSYVINIDVLFILIVALKQNDWLSLSFLIC